jgi:hypothetical protein
MFFFNRRINKFGTSENFLSLLHYIVFHRDVMINVIDAFTLYGN